MTISCKQEQASFLFSLDKTEDALASLESAQRLLADPPDPWHLYCIWNTKYAIELKRNRPSEADHARTQALTAYQNYRRSGGAPKRPETMGIAELTFHMRNMRSSMPSDSAAAPRAFTPPDIAPDTAIRAIRTELFSAIGDWLGGKLSATELLKMTVDLDEYYELHFMIYVLSSD